jgi:hypothetical protein
LGPRRGAKLPKSPVNPAAAGRNLALFFVPHLRIVHSLWRKSCSQVLFGFGEVLRVVQKLRRDPAMIGLIGGRARGRNLVALRQNRSRAGTPQTDAGICTDRNAHR